MLIFSHWSAFLQFSPSLLWTSFETPRRVFKGTVGYLESTAAWAQEVTSMSLFPNLLFNLLLQLSRTNFGNPLPEPSPSPFWETIEAIKLPPARFPLRKTPRERTVYFSKKALQASKRRFALVHSNDSCSLPSSVTTLLIPIFFLRVVSRPSANSHLWKPNVFCGCPLPKDRSSKSQRACCIYPEKSSWIH